MLSSFFTQLLRLRLSRLDTKCFLCYNMAKGRERMLIYYIRHGDPIYNPDSLTELGEKQAEALSHRLGSIDFDRIYVSTSNRAYLTAKPTLEKCGKEPIMTDWLHESVAAKYFYKDSRWIFTIPEYIEAFNSESMFNLGKRWSDHECFDNTNVREGRAFFSEKISEFFRELGYIHDEKSGCYHRMKNSEEDNRRIAVFAHEGMSKVFLSTVLDIPYPLFCSRFSLSHSCMCVISFAQTENRPIYPRLLQMSNDSHLYKEGLPLIYNHGVEI